MTYSLITGLDTGNTSTKTSYIDSKSGNIVSFPIPSVIAPAPPSVIELHTEASNHKINPEEMLHVYIETDSLEQHQRKSYFYVGQYAIDKADMQQPQIDTDKHNSSLHKIVSLTSLAVAALKDNIASTEDEIVVEINYSGGLPIEEHKKVGQKPLEDLKGKHKIQFLDGPAKGKTVVLNITGGKLRVEGATSGVSLSFDIQSNELVATKDQNLLTSPEANYIVADLGAGTLDEALYENSQLNKVASRNVNLGTNTYVDQLLDKVLEIPEFQPIIEALKVNNQDGKPYRTREEFMKQVIYPGVKLAVEGKTPKFTVSWGRKRNIDFTQQTLEVMGAYASDVMKEVDSYWSVKGVNAEHFYLVGGGVLFGYEFFKNEEDIKLPDASIISESPFITSRAYLIANYFEQKLAGALN